MEPEVTLAHDGIVARGSRLLRSPRKDLGWAIPAVFGSCVALVLLDCMTSMGYLSAVGGQLESGQVRDSVDLLLCSLLAGVCLHIFVCSSSFASKGGETKACREAVDQDWSSEARSGGDVRRPAARNAALDGVLKQGDPEIAARALMKLEAAGKQADAVSYNLVMNAFAKKGDVKSAREWLSHMERRGVHKSACSYNTMLDAYARANDPKRCEDLLEHMLDKGVSANVISYATVIYGHARRGSKAKAEAWFQRMTEARVQPDATCYNSLIHACSVSGSTARAAFWLQDMQEQGLTPTVHSFTALIDACAKNGDHARAEDWFRAMSKQGIKGNVITYSALIDACAKSGNLTRAAYWLEEMPKAGVEPNAHSYSAVINACAKSGNVDAAERWLARFEQTGHCDVVVYSTVIDACGKSGDEQRTMAAFRRMEAHGIKSHIVAYSALARPFAYKGMWQEVESIAAEMVSNGVTPNEYFVYAQLLSYAMSRPRQGPRAERCFRNAIAIGIKSNDHIASALARCLGRPRSFELIQEMCGSTS